MSRSLRKRSDRPSAQGIFEAIGYSFDYGLVLFAGACSILMAVVALGSSADRHVAIAAMCVGLVALIGGAFRADLAHIQSSGSVTAVSCGLSVSLVVRVWPQLDLLGAAVFGICAMVAALRLALNASSDRSSEDLPHLQGVSVDQAVMDAISTTKHDLL